jgi:hypothetical protein
MFAVHVAQYQEKDRLVSASFQHPCVTFWRRPFVFQLYTMGEIGYLCVLFPNSIPFTCVKKLLSPWASSLWRNTLYVNRPQYKSLGISHMFNLKSQGKFSFLPLCVRQYQKSGTLLAFLEPRVYGMLQNSLSKDGCIRKEPYYSWYYPFSRAELSKKRLLPMYPLRPSWTDLQCQQSGMQINGFGMERQDLQSEQLTTFETWQRREPIAVRSGPKRAICVWFTLIFLYPPFAWWSLASPSLEKHLGTTKRRSFTWTLHNPSEGDCPESLC